MMIPSGHNVNSQTLAGVTSQGGSIGQMQRQQLQGYSQEAANQVPQVTQQIAGITGAVGAMAQDQNTARHGMVQAAQNFTPGPDETTARNAAQALNQRFRTAILSQTPNGPSAMQGLAQLIQSGALG